jgi:hypothetical protein
MPLRFAPGYGARPSWLDCGATADKGLLLLPRLTGPLRGDQQGPAFCGCASGSWRNGRADQPCFLLVNTTLLLSLEALVLELEGLAVLGNGAHNVVRYSFRNMGMDLQRNFYLRTE